MSKSSLSARAFCAVALIVVVGLVASHPSIAEWRPRDISWQTQQLVTARGDDGDCPDILPPQNCPPEEFCSDNNCTGEPKDMELPGGAIIKVKTCDRVNQSEQTHDDFDWYEPVAHVEFSFFQYVETVRDNCLVKCGCLDYCRLVGPPNDPRWVCQTSTSCITTGWIDDLDDYDLGLCPDDGGG